MKNIKPIYGVIALGAAFIVVGLVMTRRGETPQEEDHSAITTPEPAPAKTGPAADDGFARGFKLQQKGKLDEAITVYRQFLEQKPNHAQVRFNLGYALMAKKQCEQAIPEFERALKLDPKKSAAHLHIATCARAVGNESVAQLHQARWDERKQRRR